MCFVVCTKPTCATVLAKEVHDRTANGEDLCHLRIGEQNHRLSVRVRLTVTDPTAAVVGVLADGTATPPEIHAKLLCRVRYGVPVVDHIHGVQLQVSLYISRWR